MISICIKENNTDLLDYIMQELKASHFESISFSRHCFKIYENVIVHYKGSDFERFFSLISKLLTQAFFIYYEPYILRRLINFDYFYFDDTDKKIIIDEYKIIVQNQSLVDENERFSAVFKPVLSYVSTNKCIFFNGFVSFRLSDYMIIMEDLLQEAVNQFVLDKEYIEFVNLLKGYVDSKVPNNKVVNLVYVNSEAILLSSNGNLIELDLFDSKYLSDITFCNNDYVLNTLVGILPSKIILHLVSAKDVFIKTVELIFGDKVSVCPGCELCTAYKMLNLK